MTASVSAPPPSRSPTSWLIWLVPVIALITSAWLLHREFRSRGPNVTIEFASGAGLHAGKTAVYHKGVLVGLVTQVALKPALDGVTVQVELDQHAAALATEGASYWLVQPEIGFSGVRGLDTLLSGVQIHCLPGKGGNAKHFIALATPPTGRGDAPGRNFVLRTDKLGGLHAGTAIYYRDVKVGVVEEHRLAPDSTQVLVSIKVHEPYHRLVRIDTRFWNSGGISMKVGLTGAQVRSNSLESLVSGGVSFATPEREKDDEPAPAGTVFDIAEEGEKAWLKWKPKIDLGATGPL